MKALTVFALIVLNTAIPMAHLVHAHCQVPCGIYDDAARVTRLYEDAQTIEKSMTMIAQLVPAGDAQSANQLTRWIMAKEEHASLIMTTIAEYFLAQRVKPVAPAAEGYQEYLQKLVDHHRVMVAAMQAKQNADPKYVQALREAIDGIARYYPAEHQH
jgi:nickel superoxide dismutase